MPHYKSANFKISHRRNVYSYKVQQFGAKFIAMFMIPLHMKFYTPISSGRCTVVMKQADKLT